MTKVLITGYRGFTGVYVAERLRALGMDVLGLVQGPANAADEVSGDLSRRDELAEIIAAYAPTYVVHLAALSFVGHGDARAFYDVNLFGTLNLLEALAKLPAAPERVIIASSANVYGTPGLEVLDESVCPGPVNHYANSKLAMEHMVRTWCDRLPIVLVRPFNYTGVGQDEKFLIPKIVSHFKRRAEAIELGNLDVARDFSDVRDVAEVYARLLTSQDAIGQTVNICSGRAYALRDVLEKVSTLSGHRLEVRVNPAFVRANEVPKLVGDHSNLLKYTGFQPGIPLEETLRWMLEN
ncbi:epimerase [Acidihalobacter aeolianus]|uniref:Epimerase n=1 Tax=Acidihalobacter aeolianus TaxID=2792603 RepID=A0A1D8K918_9GAMM|nr:GDP-mannose 4,6-dehydratase [Acidihalobacter aeolianus]AOV17468.1 epimerase [Acidihalobacter aeolianus]